MLPIKMKMDKEDIIDDDIEESISDYITDETGYCHKGFSFIDKGDYYEITDIKWDIDDEDTSNYVYRLSDNIIQEISVNDLTELEDKAVELKLYDKYNILYQIKDGKKVPISIVFNNNIYDECFEEYLGFLGQWLDEDDLTKEQREIMSKCYEFIYNSQYNYWVSFDENAQNMDAEFSNIDEAFEYAKRNKDLKPCVYKVSNDDNDEELIWSFYDE